MKIENIGSNQTEVTLSDGTRILVSYSTPVAAVLPSGERIRTEKKWSVTTSRHINAWLSGYTARLVPQYVLDNLI